MQVLEALLRLRQAACHPGLIDPNRADETERQARHPAATQLAGGRRGGPQGPGLLPVHQPARHRPRAARRATASSTSTSTARPATARRASSASRPTPTCPLFLISLKAGGLGLNLTAADYVFLLDPWWNPAVESPGHRPRPPHRPDRARLRLPPDRHGHRRGEGPRAAADEARPRRRHHQRRQQPDPHPPARGPRTPAVLEMGTDDISGYRRRRSTPSRKSADPDSTIVVGSGRRTVSAVTGPRSACAATPVPMTLFR